MSGANSGRVNGKPSSHVERSVAIDDEFQNLMMIELGTDPSKLIPVLNYDGMPITADNIFRQIKGKVKI